MIENNAQEGQNQEENIIDQFITDGGFDEAFKNVFGLPDSVVKSLKEVS